MQLPFPEFLPESNWRAPTSFPDISEAKWISIDIESCDPDLKTKGPGFIRKTAFVAGVAIHTEGFSGYYPVRHLEGQNLAPNAVFEWLGDQAKHFEGQLLGAHLSYDLEGLWFEGVRFKDQVKYHDIQIAEPCIDEDSIGGYSLSALAKKYLGTDKVEDLLRDAAACYNKGYKDKHCRRPIPFDPKQDLWRMPAKFVGQYAEGDVLLPRQIFLQQEKMLDKEDLWQIFNLESALIPVLLQMRLLGVAVDLEAAEKLVVVMSREIDRHSMEIKKLVGFDPNCDSSGDMLKAYNILNFAAPELNIAQNLRQTLKGNASFTADWYAAQKDPLSKIVLRKKKLETLKNDFVIGDIIKEAINGRIHCQFTQLRTDEGGTRTGRMASKNPNLQQVPSRFQEELWDEGSPNWAEEVRKLFIANKGELFFKGDFSGQEPRLLVHFASKCKLPGIQVAVEAFRKNPLTDYHQLTTDIVNEKSGRSFKRKTIKPINLGIQYGIGLKKLCRMLNVSLDEGKEILAAYHEALPFVKALSSKAMSTAQERGFVITLLKRRCRFNLFEPVAESREEREFKVPGLPLEQAKQRWPGRRLQRSGVHKALNRICQSSAGDETKESMRQLYYDHKTVLALQIHDELAGSIQNVEQARTIKYVMENCVQLEIPMVCDARTGQSWGSAKEEVSS